MNWISTSNAKYKAKKQLEVVQTHMENVLCTLAVLK